jgi:hypothetical protein
MSFRRDELETKQASNVAQMVANHIATHGVDGARALAHHVMSWAQGDTHANGATSCPFKEGQNGIPTSPSGQQFVNSQCDQWRQQMFNNAAKGDPQPSDSPSGSGLWGLTKNILATYGAGHLINKAAPFVKRQLGLDGKHQASFSERYASEVTKKSSSRHYSSAHILCDAGWKPVGLSGWEEIPGAPHCANYTSVTMSRGHKRIDEDGWLHLEDEEGNSYNLCPEHKHLITDDIRKSMEY